MSNSRLVCGHSGCGLPVHAAGSNGWRHSLGGRTGPIPGHRKHKPVPVAREVYNQAFALDTPRDEAIRLLEKFRWLDRKINS